MNHGRTHGRMTRKHIASAGAYRRRRLKKRSHCFGGVTKWNWSDSPLVHEIDGRGAPVAIHSSLTLSPAMTVMFTGSLIITGAEPSQYTQMM